MSGDSEQLAAERAKAGSLQNLGELPTLPPPERSDDDPAASGLAEVADREIGGEVPLGGLAQHPQRLGRYVVLGTLGRGGMGVVLEAFDRTLDRCVAIKLLHRDLGTRRRQRLVREAQALAKLSHPNVVQVYEVGEAEGQVFIVMELVRGQSLGEWVRKEPRRGWRECVDVYVQAGEGLWAAHAEGLVHRDFKPDNAVIDDKGRVRVLDFGLARQAEDAESDESTRGGAGEHVEQAFASPLTRTGAVLGTPAYMPPEQMAGERADARSDQFAFCVSLYEALYGERPFEGSSGGELYLSLTAGKIRPAAKGTNVPEELRRVVVRGLEPEPGARWPSMATLLVELRRLMAPRPRHVWVLAVAGVLAAVALGLLQYFDMGSRCEGAQAQLSGVWDEARRQAVKDALLSTSLSYAPDTWTRVEHGLDEYASAWASMHAEVCEATNVRREQSAEVMDLRMACLSGRRIALRETVAALAEADATRVEKAVELVASLPVLARCEDVEALRARLPPPEDPAVDAQVQQLRERLERARSLERLGAYDQAASVADAVVEQAEGLGYGPLLAEALLQRGWIRDRKDQNAEAEADFERAYLLAAEHGHREVEVEAVARLTWVTGRQRRGEAGAWGKTALALARSPGIEPGAEILALNSMAGMLSAQHKQEEALECLRRALAIKEETSAPGYPDVATLLNNLGVLLLARGEAEEALAHFRRALAVREQLLGPTHPRLGELLISTGNALLARGEHAEALADFRRALAIKEDTLGAGHLATTSPLLYIGIALSEQGQLAEALTSMQRALAIYEAKLGPQHYQSSWALNQMGAVLLRQGKLAQARDHYQRALAVTERAEGPARPEVGLALVGLAEVALAEQDFDGARAPAERAVSLRESSNATADRLAEARFTLARALWPDPEQRARAIALAQQARDDYAGFGDGTGSQVELAEVQAWLTEHGP